MRIAEDVRLNAPAGVAESRLVSDPAADWVRDHFPGNPLVPGLVMLEAAVRTASALYAGDAKGQTAAVLQHLERLQIVRPVTPDDDVRVRTELLDRDGPQATFRAEIHAGGALAMRAHFRLIPGPQGAPTDDER